MLFCLVIFKTDPVIIIKFMRMKINWPFGMGIGRRIHLAWNNHKLLKKSICTNNSFELLAHLEGNSKAIQIREDIVSESDMRYSDNESELEQLVLINDWKFQTLLNHSKNDCMTSHNIYPIRSRRRMRDPFILMIKLIIWNI